MKTTIIFSILFSLIFLNGCSDSINDPIVQVENKTSVMERPDDGKNDDVPDVPAPRLVWKLEDLSVTAPLNSIYPNGLENWVTYFNVDLITPSSYMITFSSYSNADRWTNGFMPYARVTADREIIFTKSDFTSGDDNVTSISIENFGKMSFYVALFPVNGAAPVNSEDVPRDVVIRLSDIKIYAVR